MINLSRVIHSRMFRQKISVIRTPGRWEAGRWVLEEPERLEIYGIVTTSGKSLQQAAEGDRVTGEIRVLTTCRLYATDDENGISDIIIWRGAKHRIIRTSPDVDYGFFRSIGIRMEGGEIG